MTEQLIATIQSPIYYDQEKGSSQVKISVPSGRSYSVGLLDWDPVGDGEHLIMHPEWKYYQEELELAKRLESWNDREGTLDLIDEYITSRCDTCNYDKPIEDPEYYCRYCWVKDIRNIIKGE